MTSQNQADVSPAEWDGVYYDSGAGEIVTTDFQDDGRVAIVPIEGDEPLHTFTSRTEFAEAETEFIEIPEHAIDDPVAVALRAYNKGYEHIMNNELEGDIALLYADTQVEIVEKTD